MLSRKGERGAAETPNENLAKRQHVNVAAMCFGKQNEREVETTYLRSAQSQSVAPSASWSITGCAWLEH